MKPIKKIGAYGATLTLLLLGMVATSPLAHAADKTSLQDTIERTFGSVTGHEGRPSAYVLAAQKLAYQKLKSELLAEGEGSASQVDSEDPDAPACEEGKDCGAKGTATPDFSQNQEDPLWFGYPAMGSQFKQGDTVTIPQPLPGGEGAGVIPAGLEKYYKQKLNWQNCVEMGLTKYARYTSSMLCAYVIVPMDYSRPDGPTIALAMSKIPAQGLAEGEQSKGAIFGNPGGPGGTGLWTAITHASQNPGFDGIGFDPRGVGSSLPQIRCESSDTKDKERSNSDLYTTEWLNKQLEYNTQQCYTNTARGYNGITGEEFIPTVGTANVVRDLDVMRSVVNQEKLTYIGYSYGTSIGYHYATTFPENTRALVLDGQVNPFENNEQLLYGSVLKNFFPAQSKESPDVSQMRGFGETFVQFLKDCLTRSNCALGEQVQGEPSEEQVASAYQAYQDIVRKAWGTGYYTNSKAPNRPVSFYDLNMGTISAMYSNNSWSMLRFALNDLKDDRDAARMMALADKYYGRDAKGHYEFSDAAFRTISCTDSWENYDDQAHEGQNKADVMRVAPFSDPGKDPVTGKQRGIEPQYGWCHYYKERKKLPQGRMLQGDDLPSALVVSSSYDPATPYENGVLSAVALRAPLLSVANASHCAYGSVDCATKLVEEFISNPEEFRAGVRSNAYNLEMSAVKAENPRNKDIYSHVLSGQDAACRVQSFDPALVSVNVPEGESGVAQQDGRYVVKAGQQLLLTYDGFVQDQPLETTLGGQPLENAFLADKFNRIVDAPFTVPAEAKGDVDFVVSGFNGSATLPLRVIKTDADNPGAEEDKPAGEKSVIVPDVTPAKDPGKVNESTQTGTEEGEQQGESKLPAGDQSDVEAKGEKVDQAVQTDDDPTAVKSDKAVQTYESGKEQKPVNTEQIRKVAAPGAQLSNTGALAGLAAGGAVLLVLAGAGLVVARRRMLA